MKRTGSLALRQEIGDATFRTLLREWPQRYAGQTKTTADYIALASEIAGRDLAPFLNAWLYGITRKTVSDYRRRAFFRRLFTGVNRSLESSPQIERTSGVDPYARVEAQQAIAAVLKKMTTVRRAAFILFEIEGYSGEEIAELEQIPVATVYTRLHHARRDFMTLLARAERQERSS